MPILFRSDISSYGASIDLTTPNRSFIKIASIYKQMGVINHTFMLVIIDRDLIGVDPHSTNLTQIQKIKLHAECKINPWYYLREVARAPGIMGEEDLPIRANRSIIAIWWMFFNHITQLDIQIRQTGKSFASEQLANYLANIHCESATMNCLTRNEKLRSTAIARIKAMNKCLPPYLNMTTSRDARNTQEFTIKALNNSYTVHLPASSEKSANGLGRGFTTGINFGEEGPFAPNTHITTPAMLAAGGAARDAARRAGTAYGTIFMMTAGNRGTKEGAYFYKLMSNAANWDEKMLDCEGLPELEKVIRANSRPDEPGRRPPVRVNLTLSHRQLGYTDEWLETQIEDSLATGDEVRTDFLNLWSTGALVSPFTKAQSAKMSNSTRDPGYTEIHPRHGYITRWYIDEYEIPQAMSKTTILSADTSDAIGNDSIAVMIRNPNTGKTMATVEINITNLMDVIDWFIELFLAYPKMLGIIENRSTGQAIMDGIVRALVYKGINPWTRLFNMVVDQKEEFPDRYKEMENSYLAGPANTDFHTRYKKFFGFKTAGSGVASRHKLYSETLMSAVETCGDVMYDRTLINQINGLQTKNNRVDHDSDNHDDMAISWLLGQFVLTKANHVEYYGLDSQKRLRKLKAHIPKNVSAREAFVASTQQKLRDRIDGLKQDYGKSKIASIKLRIKMEILELSTRIIHNNSDRYNIDQILHDMQESENIEATSHAPKLSDLVRNSIGIY